MEREALNRRLQYARRAPFLELVDWLERTLAARARVGEAGPALHEVVCFRHDASLAFPSSDIRSARLHERDGAGPWVELTTTFLGLTGEASPLPGYIADEIVEDEPNSARRALLDLFHHRLIGLLQRGSTRLHHYRQYREDGRDICSLRALCLSGIDAGAGPPPRHLSWREQLLLGPLLVGPQVGSRHAVEAGLRALFQDELEGARLSVVEYTGGRLPLPRDQRARLGRTLRLGRTGVLGDGVRHRAGAIRVELLSLSLKAFGRLSEGGERQGALREAIELLTQQPVDYEIMLRPRETRRTGFGLGRGVERTLGRSTWLRGAQAQPLTMYVRTGHA